MAPPLYTFTIPIFINGLETLSLILKKAEAHAQEKNISPDVLINARLYEDMKALPFQVAVATITPLKVVARAVAADTPAWEEPGTTFAELYSLIEKTLAKLRSVDAVSFAPRGEAETFKTPVAGAEREFTVESYATGFGLPNFFFHVNTAYAILRAQGVPLGKGDYLKNFVE